MTTIIEWNFTITKHIRKCVENSLYWGYQISFQASYFFANKVRDMHFRISCVLKNINGFGLFINSQIITYSQWVLTFYYHYWNVFTTTSDFLLKQIFLSFMHIINVNLIVTVLRFFLSTFAFVSFSQKLSCISKFLACVCWQFLLFCLSLLFPSQFPNILVKNVPWQICMSNLAFKVSCILYDILIQIRIPFIFKYVVVSIA